MTQNLTNDVVITDRQKPEIKKSKKQKYKKYQVKKLYETDPKWSLYISKKVKL